MNISNLERLVEEENQWMRARGAQPLSLLSSKDRQEIATIIDCRLSPENLHCARSPEHRLNASIDS